MKKAFSSRIRFIFIPIIAFAFLFLVSFLVMHLWNYTLPELFAVKTINLWQAMALFILCKILFGFGGGGPKRGGPPWAKRSAHRKWQQVGEADRERFRAYMRSSWCHRDEPGKPLDNTGDAEDNDKSNKKEE